jgi:hypothetical protein
MSRFHHRTEIAPQAPGVRAIPAPHFQHVAKAACGDQPDPAAVPLQQGVGADGGAVHDGIDLAQLPETAKPGVKSHRLRPAVGGHLGDRERAGFAIETDQIGIGAPDVHADDETHRAGSALT